MAFEFPKKPGRDVYGHLYYRNDKEIEELRDLVEKWCREKKRECRLVLVPQGRELPIHTFPALRTEKGTNEGVTAIKRFIQDDLRRSA